MERLIEGVHQFRASDFGGHGELLAHLARDGQDPHTLFITCADSRVVAELITNSQPGDIFVVKNIGNIIPAFEIVASTNSTAAAIEFAVSALEVEDIVVCGHTQCGAMTALIGGIRDPREMPHLARWIEVAAPVRAVIEERYGHLGSVEERVRAAERENVLFGLENLQTYPAVQRRLLDGSLHLHGWLFNIALAELFEYSASAHQFAPLVAAE